MSITYIDTPGLDGEDWPKRTDDTFAALGLDSPAISKGDYPGHPFRGNQHVRVASSGGRVQRSKNRSANEVSSSEVTTAKVSAKAWMDSYDVIEVTERLRLHGIKNDWLFEADAAFLDGRKTMDFADYVRYRTAKDSSPDRVNGMDLPERQAALASYERLFAAGILPKPAIPLMSSKDFDRVEQARRDESDQWTKSFTNPKAIERRIAELREQNPLLDADKLRDQLTQSAYSDVWHVMVINPDRVTLEARTRTREALEQVRDTVGLDVFQESVKTVYFDSSMDSTTWGTCSSAGTISFNEAYFNHSKSIVGDGKFHPITQDRGLEAVVFHEAGHAIMATYIRHTDVPDSPGMDIHGNIVSKRPERFEESSGQAPYDSLTLDHDKPIYDRIKNFLVTPPGALIERDGWVKTNTAYSLDYEYNETKSGYGTSKYRTGDAPTEISGRTYLPVKADYNKATYDAFNDFYSGAFRERHIGEYGSSSMSEGWAELFSMNEMRRAYGTAVPKAPKGTREIVAEFLRGAGTEDWEKSKFAKAANDPQHLCHGYGPSPEEVAEIEAMDPLADSRAIAKGDYPGHPFRGNQHVRVAGGRPVPRKGLGRSPSDDEVDYKSASTVADDLLAIGAANGIVSGAVWSSAVAKVDSLDVSLGGNPLFVGLSGDSFRANVKDTGAARVAERLARDPEFLTWFENHDHDFAKSYARALPSFCVDDNMGKPLDSPRDAAYRTLNFVMRTWAGEVADSASTPLAIQVAANREFGGPASSVKDMLARTFAESEFGGARRKESQVRLGDEIREKLDYDEPALRAVHRAIYAETQDQLAKAGIKEVTLYRGTGIDVNQTSNTFEATTNPLSSWTLHRQTASDFAHGVYSRPPGQTAAIVATTVPASQVYSTPFTGLGCLNEAEFVLVNTTGSIVRRRG